MAPIQNTGLINAKTHLVRRQNFRKTNISYPLTHIRKCAYHGVMLVFRKICERPE